MNTDYIRLTVDEPIDGHFYWILQQRDHGDGNPRAVEAAPGPMPTYGSALMAGISALQRRTFVTEPDLHLPSHHPHRIGRGGHPASGPSTIY